MYSLASFLTHSVRCRGVDGRRRVPVCAMQSSRRCAPEDKAGVLQGDQDEEGVGRTRGRHAADAH